MRTLLLFRHGKSDWNVAVGDLERPINRRGQRAAATMGRFLAEARQVPDLVVTSPAVRARSTVQLAAEAGGWTCPVEVDEGLYESSVERVLDVIRSVDDGRESLLLAGHEPVWSEMVSSLCGGCWARFPTAAMARVDLSAPSWSAVAPGRGQLVWLVPPKLFRSRHFGGGS